MQSCTFIMYILNDSWNFRAFLKVIDKKQPGLSGLSRSALGRWWRDEALAVKKNCSLLVQIVALDNIIT